jgi:hypothetical protein
MTVPLQLAIPETAQVHIHFCAPPALADAVAVPQPRRHPLLLAATAILLFGGGYVVRGMTTTPAVAAIPRTPIAMPLPPTFDLLAPGALPVVPQTPAGLSAPPAAPRTPTTSATPAAPPTPAASVAPGAPRSPFGLD